jgi:Zn-dependent membrane protease YugP
LELSQLTSNQADVTPADFKSITGTKDYDGSTSFQQAQVTGVNNETFTTSANANSKNASSNAVDPASRFDRVNGGLVVAEGSTGDLRNYNNFSLDRLSVNQAVITPKPLLVNGVTANDKVYDGTKAVELDTSQALTSTSGVVAGEDVSLKTVTGLFVDKNVGTNKRVDLSQIEFNGASKENYMAAAQQTTTANITPKELVVSGLKAQDKVYDGNQAAQVDTSKPFADNSGLVKNDDVQVSSVTGTFADKNSETNKTVALSKAEYSGADKNNYLITDQKTSTATIKLIAPDPKENNGNITQVVDSTPVTPEPDVDDGNNTQVIHSRPITIDDSEDNLVNNILVVVTTPITPDDPEDNTVAQNLTPDNGSNKTPSDTSNTPVPPRVDNKNNNGNQEGKTDRPVVIPTIKDLQANPLAKINSLPSADAQAVNAATRLSSLEDDYWFLDCFFNSSQELKKIKCEPISQKKSPSLEIKKYPNKKLSALNSPLLP